MITFPYVEGCAPQPLKSGHQMAFKSALKTLRVPLQGGSKDQLHHSYFK